MLRSLFDGTHQRTYLFSSSSFSLLLLLSQSAVVKHVYEIVHLVSHVSQLPPDAVDLTRVETAPDITTINWRERERGGDKERGQKGEVEKREGGKEGGKEGGRRRKRKQT